MLLKNSIIFLFSIKCSKKGSLTNAYKTFVDISLLIKVVLKLSLNDLLTNALSTPVNQTLELIPKNSSTITFVTILCNCYLFITFIKIYHIFFTIYCQLHQLWQKLCPKAIYTWILKLNNWKNRKENGFKVSPGILEVLRRMKNK